MNNNRSRGYLSWLLGGFVLAVLLVAGFVCLRYSPMQRQEVIKTDSSAPLTEPAISAPRNAEKTVKYVGDEACRQCHEAEYSAYRQHPMGRSLAPVEQASPIERFDSNGAIAFESRGIRYRVEAAEGHPIHSEAFVNPAGEKLTEQRVPVQFAVGSGTQGRSYLINHDGHLFLSPITWYSRKQSWDLSPGYEKNNQHFDRPVIPECLYCHANHVNVDEQARNHYLGDIFRGYAIGCERCHGPGELHVARRSSAGSTDADDSIVNPASLKPKLREAVCEQCHLSGSVRLVRRGKETFDFRPGMPLEQYWSVFVKSRPRANEEQFLGHVEQMHASRCFRESKGQLGCISCHDAHRKPAPEMAAAAYRDRCLKCHDHRGCTAPAQQRQATTPVDDCVACHMPRRQTKVRHTASTDHRVLRRAGSAVESKSVPPEADESASLTHFHRRAWGPELSIAESEIDRDLGIALLMAMDVAPDAVGMGDPRVASGLLQKAVAEHADDVAAIEALALSQHIRGESRSALRTLVSLAESHPRRESAWERGAIVAQSLGQHSEAVRLWEHTIELNPWTARYHLRLAVSLANLHRWEPGAAAARRALELQPANPGARQVLVESLLGLGNKEEADREFQLLLKLDPAQAAPRRQWYDQHPLR